MKTVVMTVLITVEVPEQVDLKDICLGNEPEDFRVCNRNYKDDEGFLYTLDDAEVMGYQTINVEEETEE